MAKLGEGDKRWIVEDRKDGANVNSWHWTERDDTKWAKEAFKGIVCGSPLDTAGLVKFAKDINHWEGDVLFFNRKGKQTIVYNLELRLKWKGNIADEDGKELAKGGGQVSIYELSEEAIEDGLDLTVTVDDEATGGDALRELVKREAARVLSTHAVTFHELLKARLAEIMNGGPPVVAPVAAAAAPAAAPAESPETTAAAAAAAAEESETAAAEASEAEGRRIATLGQAYRDAISGALNGSTEWDLSGSALTDVEMEAMMEAVLAAEPPLASLNLASNALTDSGLQAVCIALGKGGAPDLMALDFRENPGVTAAGRNMFKGLRTLRGKSFEATFDD